MRETAADCGVLKMSISDFLKKVWTPAHSKIEKVCEELDDGKFRAGLFTDTFHFIVSCFTCYVEFEKLLNKFFSKFCSIFCCVFI